MERNKKIIISANTSWNIINFRSTLITTLVAEGFEVIALAPYDNSVESLREIGCQVKDLPIDARGTSVKKEILLFLRYLNYFRLEKPDAYLAFTIKPNIYGSLAARVFNVPTINNITGLGATYIKKTWKTSLVNWLYKLSLCSSKKIFFQNNEDLQYFVSKKIIAKKLADKVPGSGVNLNTFSYHPCGKKRKTRFIMISRLLAEKGIDEYIEAAQLIEKTKPDAEFLLLGPANQDSRSAAAQSQISSWLRNKTVRYLGETADVREYLYSADCVVLPSYREGVPRVLLEAAAVGRPIITTTAPGCNDAVDDGITGFTCKVADGVDLARKIEKFLGLNNSERVTMGLMARKKMERQFDEKFVVEKYISVLRREV